MQRDSVDRIKYIFRHEREIKDAVLEAKTGAGGHTGGTSGHCRVSDPTPAAALRRVEEVSCVTLPDRNQVTKPERWLKVVEAVRAWVSSDVIDNEIFHRVLTSPKPQSREEARRRRDRVCEYLHIEKSLYYDRIPMICIYGIGVADANGAL